MKASPIKVNKDERKQNIVIKKKSILNTMQKTDYKKQELSKISS